MPFPLPCRIVKPGKQISLKNSVTKGPISAGVDCHNPQDLETETYMYTSKEDEVVTYDMKFCL